MPTVDERNEKRRKRLEGKTKKKAELESRKLKKSKKLDQDSSELSGYFSGLSVIQQGIFRAMRWLLVFRR